MTPATQVPFGSFFSNYGINNLEKSGKNSGKDNFSVSVWSKFRKIGGFYLFYPFYKKPNHLQNLKFQLSNFAQTTHPMAAFKPSLFFLNREYFDRSYKSRHFRIKTKIKITSPTIKFLVPTRKELFPTSKLRFCDSSTMKPAKMSIHHTRYFE